jgi:quercetin dioxygenase-like cupin family protein
MKPLLENDQVKIYEATIKVGEKTPEHSHSANEAIYVLSGGKGRITLPDGTTRINEYKTGEVIWRTKPETHTAENTGDTEIRLLTVQFQETKGEGEASRQEHIAKERTSDKIKERCSAEEARLLEAKA